MHEVFSVPYTLFNKTITADTLVLLTEAKRKCTLLARLGSNTRIISSLIVLDSIEVHSILASFALDSDTNRRKLKQLNAVKLK